MPLGNEENHFLLCPQCGGAYPGEAQNTRYKCPCCGHKWLPPVASLASIYLGGLDDVDVQIETDNGRLYPVSNFPCDIGRGGDIPDLQSNRAVSRKHCCISYESGRGFNVTPYETPGGTFLDDVLLAPGSCHEIKPGQTLLLAGVPIKIKCRVKRSASLSPIGSGKDVDMSQAASSISYLSKIDEGEYALHAERGAGSIAVLLRNEETSQWSILALDRQRISFNGEVFVEKQLHNGSAVSLDGYPYVFSADEQKLLAENLKPGAELAITKLAAGYDSKLVLGDISCHIPKGQITAVIGRSGCGKTTLVKILSGLKQQKSGKISVDGENLVDYAAWASQHLGCVPQFNAVHGELSVRQVVGYAADISQEDASEQLRDTLIDNVLNETQLTAHKDKLVDELSGGQQKRVNIACKIISSPKVLLLDEPTTGLDCATEHKVIEILKKMSRQGRTIIYVTHSVATIDAADHVIVIETGDHGAHVAAEGSPKELLQVLGKYTWEEVFDDLDEEHANSAQGPVKNRLRLPWFSVLFSRYLSVWLNSPISSMALLMGLPLILGILIRMAVSIDAPQGTDRLIFALVAMFWLCMNQSVREIIKEREIFIQEKFAGVSSVTYLFSKCLFFFLLAIPQSALIAAPVMWLNFNSNEATYGFVKFGQLNVGFMSVWGMLFLAGIVGAALGLLLSSCSLFIKKKGEVAAILFAVIFTLPQILFSAKVMPNGKLADALHPESYYSFALMCPDAPVAEFMSYFTFSRYLYLPLDAASRDVAALELSKAYAFNVGILVIAFLCMLVITWLLLELYAWKARR